MSSMTQLAAIFDMDGTLVDNNPYHFEAWKVLFERHGKPPINRETFNESMSGVPAVVVAQNFFGLGISEHTLQQLVDERNEIYYELARPNIAAINGLERLLSELKDVGWKTAIASSAIRRNIDFVLEKVLIRQYFDTIIDSHRVQKPKPNPQIFLKAAEELQVPPEHCIIFEDSISGVKAANAAGMKVVALTTTHKAQELQPVNLTIDDYSGLTAQRLSTLFKKD